VASSESLQQDATRKQPQRKLTDTASLGSDRHVLHKVPHTSHEASVTVAPHAAGARVSKSTVSNSSAVLTDLENRAKIAERHLEVSESDARRAIQKHNAETKRLSEQVREAKEQASEADVRCRQAEIRLGNIEAKFSSYRSQAEAAMKSFELEKGTLLSQLEQSEANVRRLLDSALKDQIDGKWNPLPDETIRSDMQNLHTKVRDWCKRWATTSLLDLRDKATNPHGPLMTYLGRFIVLNDNGTLPAAIDRPSGRMRDKIPAVLLNAALSDEINKTFFTDPCFCVGAESVSAFSTMLRELITGTFGLTVCEI
jgi:hypothetical protein